MLESITTCRDLYVHNRTQQQLQTYYRDLQKLARQLEAIGENLAHNREFGEFLTLRFPTVGQKISDNLAHCRTRYQALEARFTGHTLQLHDPVLHEFLRVATRTVRTFDCVASVYLRD